MKHLTTIILLFVSAATIGQVKFNERHLEVMTCPVESLTEDDFCETSIDTSIGSSFIISNNLNEITMITPISQFNGEFKLREVTLSIYDGTIYVEGVTKINGVLHSISYTPDGMMFSVSTLNKIEGNEYYDLVYKFYNLHYIVVR